MCRVSKRAVYTFVIEDTEYLASKMTDYCDLCQLRLFYDIVKLQYVDIENYDTRRMLYDIYLALSDLKRVYKVNGGNNSLTPDTLYQCLVEFSLLLLPIAKSWSFNLVALFYNASNVELQETIRFDEYILPNNSNLTTLFSQTSALQILREKYVLVFKLLSDERKRVLLLL